MREGGRGAQRVVIGGGECLIFVLTNSQCCKVVRFINFRSNACADGIVSIFVVCQATKAREFMVNVSSSDGLLCALLMRCICNLPIDDQLRSSHLVYEEGGGPGVPGFK